MTDLSAANRGHLMHIVYAVESALRARLTPAKMNLASLGNATPHLHWHVVPRFADDTHFPQPVWGPRQRDTALRPLPEGFVEALAGDLAAMLGASLAQ
jgi:diadenosine tetraphosphate (Ap4A) HIT family hydrolase